MQSVHTPVLLNEIVSEFSKAISAPQGKTEEAKKGPRVPESETAAEGKKEAAPEIWYLDGTLGGPGHALAIAEAFEGKIGIIGFDRDPQAIERAKEILKGKAQDIILENENYRDLDKVLDKYGIKGINLVLLDLGISSDELENSGRGFSFQKDEPLLMTLGDPAKYPFTAADIVNNWEENVLADIIFGYGEERYARRIARYIVRYRLKKRIETSGELAEIVKSAIPQKFAMPFGGKRFEKRIHPATRTFQALRIAVNDELNALRDGLNKGYEKLNANGRMAVISFHSLEDRIVKNFYKEKEKSGSAILTKKPIIPTPQEMAENPRSRSAKLRILQK